MRKSVTRSPSWSSALSVPRSPQPEEQTRRNAAATTIRWSAERPRDLSPLPIKNSIRSVSDWESPFEAADTIDRKVVANPSTIKLLVGPMSVSNKSRAALFQTWSPPMPLVFSSFWAFSRREEQRAIRGSVWLADDDDDDAARRSNSTRVASKLWSWRFLIWDWNVGYYDIVKAAMRWNMK